MQRRAAALVFLMTAATFPSSAWGAKRRPGLAATHAVFPLVEQGEVDSRVLGRLAKLMGEVTPRGVRILSGRPLARRLGGRPSVALERCKSDRACMGHLGRKLHVSELLVARASPQPDGLRIVFIAIGVDRREAVRTVVLSIDEGTDVEPAYRRGMHEIFGRDPATGRASSLEAVDRTAAGRRVWDSEPEATPSPEEPALIPLVPIAPLVMREATLDHQRRRRRGRLPRRLLSQTPAHLTLTAPEPEIDRTPPWLRYAAYSAGAAGAILLGAGGYYGWHSRALRQQHAGATQLEVGRQRSDQRRMTWRANMLLTTGGVVTLLAVGAWVFDRSSAATDSPALAP